MGTEQVAILIADLGYGDAGKGSIVDFLTREQQAHTIIRYNGGAQAAHNVITPDGRHHTFAQFGSGMFLPGVHTHLSRFMILHPQAMLAEERHLSALGVQGAFARTTIDREALVITPYHQAANRLKEIARGSARHGSCGMGVGETMADWLERGADALVAGDFSGRANLLRKLNRAREAMLGRLAGMMAILEGMPEAQPELRTLRDPRVIDSTAESYHRFVEQVQLVDRDYLAGLLSQPGTVIFEGAQGVLLDEWWGFPPYNSWSTLTYANAERLLDEAGYFGERQRLGLIRAYATRHGAGPFISEDAELSARVQDSHNENNPWQRAFRVGYLDLVALRYALQVCGGADGLVISHLDRLREIRPRKVCEAYQYPGLASDLDEHFVHHGNSVSEIRVAVNPADLERQERLTHQLFKMQPIYTDYLEEETAFIEQVAAALDLPVAITSHGPSCNEKKISQEPRYKITNFMSGGNSAAGW